MDAPCHVTTISSPGPRLTVYDEAPTPVVTFPADELRSRLSRLEYEVTQNNGTEKPFTGLHLYVEGEGDFRCIVCDNVLFTMEDKFDSGTGWPSFSAPAQGTSVAHVADTSHRMVRTAVVCARCGAHLGHLFNDRPEGNGMRYCINSICLNFEPAASKSNADQHSRKL